MSKIHPAEPPIPTYLKMFKYKNIWKNGDVYLRRFFLCRIGKFSLKLHQIFQSDVDRDLHDHPWSFFSFMIKGGYWEERPVIYNDPGMTVVKYHHAPCFIYRKSTDLHRLKLNGVVHTLVVTTGRERKWGFQTKDRWIPWDEYVEAGEVVTVYNGS